MQPASALAGLSPRKSLNSGSCAPQYPPPIISYPPTGSNRWASHRILFSSAFECPALLCSLSFVSRQVSIQVSVPVLAFLLDTTTEVLEYDVKQSDLIYSCPIIMIECSYLERDMESEARTRKHVVWTELQPYIVHSITEAQLEGRNPNTWILIHFSLRCVVAGAGAGAGAGRGPML